MYIYDEILDGNMHTEEPNMCVMKRSGERVPFDRVKIAEAIFSMFSPVPRCFFRCDRPPVQAQFTLRLRFTGKPDRGMMYSLMISFVTVQLLSFQ